MTSVALVTPAQLDSPVALKIREAAPQFAPFLPANASVEQVVAAVYLECQRVPAILQCTPESVVMAASQLVQWGFDIGRTGYLVPFKGKATPVPHYRGYIELVTASGAARSCEAREVREGDFFEYQYGTEGRIKHVPGGKDARNPGKMTHFYAIWYIGFGVSKWEVMTVAEVEKIHKNSKQWATSPLESIPWYGVKTVIRKSAKQFAQSPKLSRFFNAIQQEETAELGAPVLTATSKIDEPPVMPALAAGESPDEATGEILGAAVDELDLVELPTVNAALVYILPGRAGSWGGYGGKPLGECRNTVLQKASEWCVAQMEKPDGYTNAAELKMNVDAVLAARAAGTIQEPAKAA